MNKSTALANTSRRRWKLWSLVLVIGMSMLSASALYADVTPTPEELEVSETADETEAAADVESEAKSSGAASKFIMLLSIFVLAIFIGFEIITKVPGTLHTPLMSGANAISGITLVGALLSAGVGSTTTTQILGMAAIIFAMVNVVGGFMVTHRMLEMFQPKKRS